MFVPVGKKSRKNRSNDNLPEGMSRRQAKLAARAAERERLAGNPRPFAELDSETDLVALREFVSSAELPVTVADSDRQIRLCSVLPGGAAALTRADGAAALVALQTKVSTADVAADLARALDWARSAGPGEVLERAVADESTPKLTELLTEVHAEDIIVHDDFSWWLPDDAVAAKADASLQAANEAIIPSARIAAEVPGAVWWADPGERAHIRWIRTEPEAKLLDALARVHAENNLSMGEGTKFAGMFRTDGLVVPVWDVDREQPVDHWAAGVVEMSAQIDKALESTANLTADERKSRQTIVSRQVTLR
ncbi:preprotein translocase subunit SecA [Corynebacterium sp. TAE3-ERU12]|uniref:DUF5926 family protein n=1 Tax=Corynebacterium sp. TAE3-ERU12 TaxID=2849491 RepID=UPI001C450AA4|nr:DUF5926 family protein [Corynebacterium sp. TAE3-ERU12]MBV7296087.1 preprotein translocase subunit SecA [Corynebacterium sp. TAE3-ERU12]